MEIKELQDLYFCNWPYKFWGPASIQAPNALLTLNHFENAASVLGEPLQEYFEIYWFEQGITGEVKLPGEWNYCYFKGKYYHLEKSKSDGYFENKGELVEFFFYTVVYDEWANEFLTNQVNVRGTLAKTGDHLLAARYIHTITPIVTNGNDVIYIDAQEKEKIKSDKSETRRQAKERLKKAGQEYLRKMGPKAPKVTVALDTPLMRGTNQQHYPIYKYWPIEASLIYQLHEFIARDDLHVYDVDKTKLPVETFNSVYGHSGQLYSIASDEDTSYIFSTTINKALRIRWENLKVKHPTAVSLWDLYYPLDPNTFQPIVNEDTTKTFKIDVLKLKNGVVTNDVSSGISPTLFIYNHLFLKFIDSGLLHTEGGKAKPTLTYNKIANKLRVPNQTPRSWRVGNRVWTIEELEKTKWFHICKPYEKIGVDEDGNPLYFLGFDPNRFIDEETTKVGGKSLVEWLKYLRTQNTIDRGDLPYHVENLADGNEWGLRQLVKPLIEVGNPGLWFSDKPVKEVYFPYDPINRERDWRGVVFDKVDWKIWTTERVNPKDIPGINWVTKLKESISRNKVFGLHNSRLGYEIAKRRGPVPGSVQYFVPIYEDKDESLTEDWIFAATAIVGSSKDTRVKLPIGVGSKQGDKDYCPYLGGPLWKWEECFKTSESKNWPRYQFYKKLENRYILSQSTYESHTWSPFIDENILLYAYDTKTDKSKQFFELVKQIPDREILTAGFLGNWFNWDRPAFKDIEVQSGEADARTINYWTYVDRVYSDIEEQIRNKPIILDFEGYLAYCIIKKGKWHFELLIKDNDYLTEGVKCIRHVFTPKEELKRPADQLPTVEDVIQAINSSNVINVYGQDIPVRDRFIIDGNEIDWNLHISALKDKYQAASNYFLVEADSPESLVRLTLDVPKEAAFAVQTISPTDKRDTLLSFVNSESNRYYERNNLELERKKFHIDFEREGKYLPGKRSTDWGSWVSGIFGVIAGAITTAAGVALMATGVGGVPGVALATAGLGMIGGVGGSIAQGAGLGLRHNEEDEERADRLRHTTDSFKLRGEQMHVQHQEAERQEMVQIRNMANANTYGNTTHAINYQGFNEHYGTTDIHLAHYRPTRDVLERLKWYYEEFGFDLMVPNQRCYGISTIKGHIRFSQIVENTSTPNQTIRSLIEGRLLAGVRIVDLEGQPLGPHDYPDTVLYETCLTRYDQLKEELDELNRQKAELEKVRDKLQYDIGTYDGQIREKDKVIAYRDEIIANKIKELEDKDKEIANKVKEVQDKEAELKAFEGELTKALGITPPEDRGKIVEDAKFKSDQYKLLKNTVNGFRTWSKELTGILGLPEGSKGADISNRIRGTLTDLNKAKEDIKGLEAAKQAETAKLDKAIEDGRIKEEEHNQAMRAELNKRTQVEQRLREETRLKEEALKDKEQALRDKETEHQLKIKAKEEDCAQHIRDLEAKHKTELDKANEPKLTCEQFRKLAGHYTYDLLDPKLVEDVERMAMTLAVTVKYMLLFNVDQRFAQDHEFQSVFKDLYDIAESDLVEGFLDVFGSPDWYQQTFEKWGSEWSGEDPNIENHSRAEAERMEVLLQYKDKGNDGRLFRGTDKDVLTAAKIVLTDLSEDIGPQAESYQALRAKAMANLNAANLNHLKEVLDDLSLNLERVTLDYLIDLNTFDTGGRSEKCKGVLNTVHCDEVNFVRLCYGYLRFYGRIWSTVDNTDVPFGVLLAAMSEASQKCHGVLDFQIVNRVSSSTIYPAIGLYARSDKWPTWSVNGKPIRKGPINHWLQIFDPKTSTKAYNDVKPVIENTAGIRIYNSGYNKTVKDTQHMGLEWCYLGSSNKVKDFYLSLDGNIIMDDYFTARAKFYERALKHMDKILEGYRPQAISILTAVLDVVYDRQVKHQDVILKTIYLAEGINIDEVFGYETWKYALIQLLTMHLYRVRFKDHGRVNTDELRVIKVERIGFVVGRVQPFINWDDAKFIKYVTDQLNRFSNYYITPDFGQGSDLFRWINRNLKVWKDPTEGSKLEGLLRDLTGLSGK